MASLTIYDSQGNEQSADGPTGQTSERISDFFYAGVKVALSRSRNYELVVFFRARSSSGSRSNQYYAVYETSQASDIFAEFRSELQHKLEEVWGYTIDTDHNEMDHFRYLGKSAGSAPGDDTTHTIVDQLLQQNERVRLGVSDVQSAFAVLDEHLGAASSFAIASSADSNALSQYDLVVETGNYRGLEPVGRTAEGWDRAKRNVRDQIVSQKVDEINDIVRDLSNSWGMSNDEIRSRVHQRVPALKSPTQTRSQRGSGAGSLGQSSSGPLDDIPVKPVLFGVAILAGIALIVFGLSIAAPGLMKPVTSAIPFLGGGGAQVQANSLNATTNGGSLVITFNTTGKLRDVKGFGPVNVTHSNGTVVRTLNATPFTRVKQGNSTNKYKYTVEGLAPGTYTVKLGKQKDTATIGSASETQTSTPTETSTPTSTPTATPTQTPTPTPTPSNSSSSLASPQLDI